MARPKLGHRLLGRAQSLGRLAGFLKSADALPVGHADLKTTERYLHYKERGDEARLLSGASRLSPWPKPCLELPRTRRN